MSRLDEMLDDWGFASKPGSTKGRIYSSRFYHAELKKEIKSLILELVGEDETDHVHAGSRNSLRSLLRQKVNEL